MKITVLGGGLSALTLTYFLQDNPDVTEIEIIEKEKQLGGLCRSFAFNDIYHDIGPHIIFSKDEEMLNLIITILGENCHKLRRSNKIIHKESWVQYPFENDLSKLPQEDLNYAVNSFINNPYENYASRNMLQFLLKTFGEGITNLYLRPYNEKIWKFDPCFMDTQMVDRIPKPPKEDILRSARGETIDGYLHQLYFYYPIQGGVQALITNLTNSISSKIKIHAGQEIKQIKRTKNGFKILTHDKEFYAEKIVSTIPANILASVYDKKESAIMEAAQALKYNSLIIALVEVAQDMSGENYVFTIADKDVIFHRISKLDFLGANYHRDGTATYMIEITYRKGDIIDSISEPELRANIIRGLKKIRFITKDIDIMDMHISRFEYAYVIYDLMHKDNIIKVKSFFENEGITLHGRFGEFEYFNMDTIFRRSKDLAPKFRSGNQKS